MAKQMKKHFLSGTMLLGALVFFARILGAIYTIPLQNILTTEGMAYYQAAFPIYALLWLLCGWGLPEALRRLVADRASYGDAQGAQQTFKTAMLSYMLVGALLTLLIFQCSGLIANAMKLPAAAPAIKAMSPAILLSLLLAGFRGYFQGMRMITPSTYAIIIEQALKLGLGLLLSSMWSVDGASKAAIGAALGVVLGELVALLMMIVMYLLGYERNQLHTVVNSAAAAPPQGAVISCVWREGSLRGLGMCLLPFCLLINALFVTNRLLNAGYVETVARAAYGVLSGVALPVSLLSSVMVLGITGGYMPMIARQAQRKQYSQLKKTVTSGIKLCILMGIPASIFLFVMAEPIVTMLFETSLPGYEITVATSLLRMLGAGSVFVGLSYTSGMTLQAIGKDSTVIINTLFSAVLYIVLFFILIPITKINVLGAAFAFVAVFAVSGVLNTVFAVQVSGISFDPIQQIGKPLFAGACTGIIAKLAYERLFQPLLGVTGGVIATLLVCTAVYAGLSFLMRSLRRDDLPFFSGENDELGVNA